MTTKPYKDEDRLREQYIEQEKSQRQLAEEWDCGRNTIYRWLNRHGIPRRENPDTGGSNRVEYALYTSDGNGYRAWRDYTVGTAVKIHQLLACLDHDPHEVFAEDTHCHHESGHPLDNRPGNVGVMSRGEHIRHHRQMDIPACKQRLMQTAVIIEEERA